MSGSSWDPVEFGRRSAAYWTAERTAKITGGKKYAILPSEGAVLLRALGLLNADASMSADAVRKYGQINHLVALLEPLLQELMGRFPRVVILDAGCGSSYLSFLLAYLFQQRWQHAAEIIGVDSNPRLIEKCAERARLAGVDRSVRFQTAELSHLQWSGLVGSTDDPGAGPLRPHLVVALHACDTATDHALAFAIAQRTDCIAVAPCCQAELARAWAALAEAKTPGPLGPIWRAAHLRRQVAAEITDTLRMLLLRGAGYEVTTTEFVPSTHTPKNTLLRAIRRGNYLEDALSEYRALRDATGGAPIALEQLLPQEHRARLGRPTPR
ncbi:MAG: methyltransferase [Candidatus Eisenbacteria bacterium]|nr:methyltransferase [Candidatus Eisenbacteria bacterium]